MRVRISFDALRLCLLVAAGITSGYLWRAAFESSSPEDVRVAAKPRIIEPAPASPVVRIPRHLVRPSRPTAAHRVITLTVARPTEQAPTGPISAPSGSTPKPTPKPGPTQTPQPTPTPTPAPTPTPPPPTSQPTRTPPSTQATTPAVSSPTQAAASPPPAAPPPTTSTTSDDDSRPGWGNGDKNHDHSGPGNEHGGSGKKNP
jgi:outer membrane biosynthesis protein TonB